MRRMLYAASVTATVAIAGCHAHPSVSTSTPPKHATADEAVMAACPAVRILGDYGNAANTAPAVTVGWQDSTDGPGIGWDALVAVNGTSYRVTECKWNSITHG